MTCEDRGLMLSRYLDADLPADAAGALEQHLTSCATCTKVMVEMTQAQALLRQDRDHPSPLASVSAVLAEVERRGLLIADARPPWRKRALVLGGLGGACAALVLLLWVQPRALESLGVLRPSDAPGSSPSRQGEQTSRAQGEGSQQRGPALLQVEAHREDGSPVLPGATVRSGERLAFHASVDRPAYLYSLQRINQRPRLLYPRPDEATLHYPGDPLRMPPRGAWLQMDQQVGLEELIVVAAARPLSQQELERRAAILPTQRLANAESAESAVYRGAESVLMASAESDGVAVVVLRVQHAP